MPSLEGASSSICLNSLETNRGRNSTTALEGCDANVMPAIGDQHKANGTGASATTNPFEDQRTAPSVYTAAEIATLQSRLDKQLGPEYISSRPGAAGQKVHYLAAEKVINLANEVFGFNGWSSAIQNIQIDFVDENAQTGKISLGLSVIVRVTLRDGTFHEDVGYGHIENCKGKAAAFEKCKKEGTTDGLKRALRTFGNVLGNCIYDKEFVAKVTKVKFGAGRWDVNELHRHPDFVPKKLVMVEEVRKWEDEGEESLKGVGDSNATSLTTSSGEDLGIGFDIADFDDADFAMSDIGHPDEVVLPMETGPVKPGQNGQMRPPVRGGTTTPSRPPQMWIAPAPTNMSRPQQSPGPNNAAGPQRPQGNPISQQQGPDRPSPNTAAPREQQPAHGEGQKSSSLGIPLQHFAPQESHQPGFTSASGHVPPVGFYSARAASSVDSGNPNPAAAPRFNPHADSPSIRKTPGVDHSKSVPVKHEVIAKQLGGQNRDFIDPRSNPARHLGGPGLGGQSPVAKAPVSGGMTTSAYRPPTRRSNDMAPSMNANPGLPGGVDRVVGGVKRPPLTDVSNVPLQHNATTTIIDGPDAKRQRLSGAGAGSMENNNAPGTVAAAGVHGPA